MLTDSKIKAAIRQAQTLGLRKVVEVNDVGERGAGRLSFQARALASRVTTEWYAVYYRDGRRRMTKIGSFPTIGLAEARKRFREEFAPVISSGASPSGRMVRRSRQNAEGAGTVRELFKAYVAHLRATNVRSSHDIETILLSKKSGSAVDDIGGDVLASDVTPEHIVGLLADIHARGKVVMAARTRSYIGAAFAWGMKAEHSYTGEHVGTKWGIKMNPVTAIASDPNSKRTSNRYLSPMEFRNFWLWMCENEKRSKGTPAVMLQLTLGQRVEEILRITTDNFDRGSMMLFWPETKNGKSHSIPLTDIAFEILDSMKPNKNGLYFPSHLDDKTPSPHGLVRGVVKTYLRDNDDVHSFIPRDIRRTWKTLAGQAGVSKEMRDRLQNHSMSGDVSNRHYDRYDYLTEKRAAMKVWGDYMDRIIAGEIDNEVVALPSAAEVI